ncbi:putative signal transducing protein [Zhouia sp. PK063]|uniref:putative signal transducing protein n=1 Tax=Zhouia sp. PK063 TaxID=3373602 RepID=UPI0037A2BECF
MDNYRKIFDGDIVTANRIMGILEEHHIEPVVKNETESARVAGFAPAVTDQVQLYVHQDEHLKVEKLLLEERL